MVKKTHIGEGPGAQVSRVAHLGVTGLIKSLARFPGEILFRSSLELDKRESSIPGCHLQPLNTLVRGMAWNRLKERPASKELKKVVAD